MITSMARPDSRMVGSRFEPAVLLHVDIQQHQIDLLLRIVNHLLGLTERRSAPAATKAGNPCHVQAIQFGHHGIIVNN